MNISKILLATLLGLSLASTGRAQQDRPSKGFTKAPKVEADEKALNFLIIGDWGRNGQEHQQIVADELGKYNDTFGAKFVISTGDNFYCCGVASAEDPQWMSSFENVYRAHSLQINWYPVLGNHDYQGNADAEVDYSHRSRRWNMKARHYAVHEKLADGSTALFVYFDSNPFITKYIEDSVNFDNVSSSLADTELVWLDSVLSHSTDSWKFVSAHHPVYGSGPEDPDQPELVQRVMPLLEKYHVDAYFSGHAHNEQYLKPANGTVHYFISGSGSKSRPVGKSVNTIYSDASPGFMAVSLAPKVMTVRVIDETGKLRYQTEVKK